MTSRLPAVLEMDEPAEFTPLLAERLSKALCVVARQFEEPDEFSDPVATRAWTDDIREAAAEMHARRLSIAMEARALARELEESSQLDPVDGFHHRIEALKEELLRCDDDEDQIFLWTLFPGRDIQ